METICSNGVSPGKADQILSLLLHSEESSHEWCSEIVYLQQNIYMIPEDQEFEVNNTQKSNNTVPGAWSRSSLEKSVSESETES